MSFSIQSRLEQCFVAELRGRVPGLTWLNADKIPEAVPPYGAVSVDSAQEITVDTGVYHVDMDIGVVHNIDEVDATQAGTFAAAVEAALNEMPRAGVDEELKLVLNGWSIVEMTTASKGQDFAHVFTLRIGCAKLERLQPESETTQVAL
jgi:hypothetical protein